MLFTFLISFSSDFSCTCLNFMNINECKPSDKKLYKEKLLVPNKFDVSISVVIGGIE